VIGQSKLKLEYDYFESIKGVQKVLVLNSQLNEDGEGEPDFDEEIIDIYYDKINNF
jgi:hypothetical protein